MAVSYIVIGVVLTLGIGFWYRWLVGLKQTAKSEELYRRALFLRRMYHHIAAAIAWGYSYFAIGHFFPWQQGVFVVLSVAYVAARFYYLPQDTTVLAELRKLVKKLTAVTTSVARRSTKAAYRLTQPTTKASTDLFERGPISASLNPPSETANEAIFAAPLEPMETSDSNGPTQKGGWKSV